MICPNCGNQIADGTAFCTNCGTQLNNAAPEQPAQNYQQPVQNYQQPAQSYQQPAQNYQQPVQNYQQPIQNYQQPVQPTLMNAENPTAGKALALGIVSLCLCWLPVASIILGIFAIKAGNETLAYSNQGYNKRPMGIIAKIFGIVSIIVCSIMTIYWLIFIIAICVAGSYATTYYYY